MVVRRSKAKRGPIGCAIAHNGVGLAQFEEQPSGRVTGRFAWMRNQNTNGNAAQVAALIQRLRRDGEFQGNEVVTCMPAEQLTFRRVALPGGRGSDMLERTREVIAHDWNVPASSLSVDYFELPPHSPSDSKEVECIAVITPHAGVRELAALMQRADLVPTAIDTSIAALARCIGTSSDGSGGPLLVVDVGGKSRTMFVVKGEDVVFACSRQDRERSTRSQAEHMSMHEVHRAGDVRSVPAGAIGATFGNAGSSSAVAQLVTSDLALEISHVVQYLLDSNLTHLIPSRGVLVGVPAASLIDGLSEAAALEFVSLQTVLRPLVHSCVARLPGDATIQDMLSPIGLALYGYEHLVGRCLS